MEMINTQVRMVVTSEGWWKERKGRGVTEEEAGTELCCF